MFLKLSLMSFIYEMLETFYFPDEKVKEIYSKYLISDLKCDKCEQKYREIISEVLITSKIYDRFDISHQYWADLRQGKKTCTNV